jgi:hypothetical protein
VHHEVHHEVPHEVPHEVQFGPGCTASRTSLVLETIAVVAIRFILRRRRRTWKEMP